MKLYLIRHALPVVKQDTNLPPGPPLGAEGHRQARSIAKWLSSKNISRVVSSDLIRVMDTLSHFLKNYPFLIPAETHESLRERESSIEGHESLVHRVKSWLETKIEEFEKHPYAIFSHCGPLNMILESFDPGKTILKYPYQCKYGCLTPIGGIWELEIEKKQLIKGKLIELWKD